jgi:hypothetical protein
VPIPTEERRPAGRPPKIANPHRWHLIVDRNVRERAEERAARRGEELTDVLRALMADYAAGRLRPSGSSARPSTSQVRAELGATTPNPHDSWDGDL